MIAFIAWAVFAVSVVVLYIAVEAYRNKGRYPEDW